MLMTLNKQRGSALVVSLFVFSLAVVITSSMIAEQALDIRRTANVLQSEQSVLYTLALEDTFVMRLEADHAGGQRGNQSGQQQGQGQQGGQSQNPGSGQQGSNPQGQQQSGGNVDHLEEAWAKPLDLTEFEKQVGAKLKGEMTDLHGCFNINNITAVNTPYVQVFKRYLNNKGLPDKFVPQIVDWIDSNTQPLSDGAEDDAYSSSKTPYRTANTPMFSVTELLAVKDIEADIYNKIKDDICVIPENNSKINVNTASADVLRALSQDLDSSSVEELIAHRKEQKGFKSVSDFLNHDVWLSINNNSRPNNSILSVKSDYFQLEASAKIDRGKAKLVSQMKRENRKIKIIWRSWGE